MNTTDLSAALNAWRQALGADHVHIDADFLYRYSQNVGGLTRSVCAVLRPASADEVQHVVRVANQFGVPIHPISCGKNWGMGSRLPVRDDTVVLDLGRMNRIREINIEQQYAIIEPGVTQAQLCSYLREKRIPLRFNVTGSAAETSIVGNALERGVGYLASRVDEVSGFEVVLGNGTLLHTGFGHFPGARMTHSYKHGIGPALDGLFFQSNFGVITVLGIALLPMPEAQMVMIARTDNPSKLGIFMAALSALRQKQILPTVVHVGNRARAEIAMAPLVYQEIKKWMPGDDLHLRHTAEKMLNAEGFSAWSAVGAIVGTPAQLRAARREIRRAMRGIAEVTFLNDFMMDAVKWLLHRCRFIPWLRRKEAILLAAEPLYRVAGGVPTSEPMKSAYWPLGLWPRAHDEDPDQSDCGMLFTLPILPTTPKELQSAVDHAELVFARHGFIAYITLNLINGHALEAVINMAFDRRSPERVAAAHACTEELTADLIRMGYIPYRVGIQSMAQVITHDDSFWQTVKAIKAALDPNNIISPGRYSLV
ncbi:MAG: FAD-binding oxidoreductase [bacterium]